MEAVSAVMDLTTLKSIARRKSTDEESPKAHCKHEGDQKSPFCRVNYANSIMVGGDAKVLISRTDLFLFFDSTIYSSPIHWAIIKVINDVIVPIVPCLAIEFQAC
jgi:hypothetical protein